MAMLIQTGHGKVLIINIYNDTEQQQALHQSIQMIWNRVCTSGSATQMQQIIRLGKFNLQHPIWDKERNAHLFTRVNLVKSQVLIDAAAEFDIQMALPKNMPTLQALSMGNYMKPDNMFISTPLINHVMKCYTAPNERPARSDHIPIVTELQITTVACKETP